VKTGMARKWQGSRLPGTRLSSVSSRVPGSCLNWWSAPASAGVVVSEETIRPGRGRRSTYGSPGHRHDKDSDVLDARDVDDPIIGRRVPFGNGWATVTHIIGKNVALIPDDQNTVVFMPREHSTASGIAHTARRVREVQRQQNHAEIRDNFRRVELFRRRDNLPRRGGSRECRPRPVARTSARRVASSSSGGSADPPPSDSDDADPVGLTRLQAAQNTFLDAIRLSGELDERELDAFLFFAAIRVAHEASRLPWELA